MTELALKIANDARSLGIEKGDTLLVHSSLRSLGGAKAEEVIEGLLYALGEEGTLVFPTLSYMNCNPSKPYFDYHETKSNVGYLPEYFRTQVEGVVRSICPTHSCAALGKNAEYITSGHKDDKTPCGKNSPFYRVMELGGKILFLGCGMNCNTSMHAVEELSEPDYLFGGDCVYEITDKDGKKYKSVCRAHGFKGVIQCYYRLADLLDETELSVGNILKAECQLVKAKPMWEKADKKYREDQHWFIDFA